MNKKQLRKNQKTIERVIKDLEKYRHIRDIPLCITDLCNVNKELGK